MRLRHHHLAALAATATLTLAACSGSSSSSAPATDAPDPAATNPAATNPAATNPAATTPDVTDPSDATVVTDPGAATETDTDSGAPPEAAPTDGSLCATIPSLDAINALLDEPVTVAEDLPRTPGEAICDVTGDGIANVQFQMLTPSDRATLEELAAELGSPLSDLDDPALPGAVTYSAAVTVFVGETSYTVQAITFDTISDPNSPAAAQRSAALLAAWLQNLGISL